MNRTEKDDIQLNPISEKQWLEYYKELWTVENEHDCKKLATNNEYVDPITMDELRIVLKTFKNCKAPG